QLRPGNVGDVWRLRLARPVGGDRGVLLSGGSAFGRRVGRRRRPTTSPWWAFSVGPPYDPSRLTGSAAHSLGLLPWRHVRPAARLRVARLHIDAERHPPGNAVS